MTPPRKIALAAVVLIAAVYVGYRIYLVLLPDETQIRNLITSMVEDFNDSDLSTVAGGVSEDYRDHTMRLDRERFLGVLRYAVLHERTGHPPRFALRGRIVNDLVEVVVDESGYEATATFRASVSRLRGEIWEDRADGDVELTLRKEDSGWMVVAARHSWTRDGRPYRGWPGR